MGYYTQYKLSKTDLRSEMYENLKNKEISEVNASTISEEIKTSLIELIENKYSIKPITIRMVIEAMGEVPNAWWNPFNGAPQKWYQHEKDMIKVSEKYPDIVWILDGIGEEGFDVWRKYFYNGKIQRANTSVVYDEFDQNKLMSLN